MLPPFYCKDQLKIELGIGISHLNQEMKYAAPPELTILSNVFIGFLHRWDKNRAIDQPFTKEV
jgi:hypothetical protein